MNETNFEWDENKRTSNIEKHGIDFADAKHVFEDLYRIEFEDVRANYGEIRLITIGQYSNIILTIVYTIRNQNIRIISARKSNLFERSEYLSKIL
jgi:uncharacterized DUF497 family protein